MNIENLLEECREKIRLLDNYYAPNDRRVELVCAFLQKVIAFEFDQIEILRAEEESLFTLLCQDLIQQCRHFLDMPNKNVLDAKILLLLILSTEQYIFDIEKLPWKIGRKVSFFEKIAIRSVFRKVLHSAYDPKAKRPVRGTRILVKISGSLAIGTSDWKLINAGKIPKPSDYDIPKEYRRKSASLYAKIDEQLLIPAQLKPYMSDVDIFIMNDVIFDSCSPDLKHTPWSFKLGEKYKTGVGGSPILEKIHQALLMVSIGGAKGRWINFVLVRDPKGYENYMINRTREVERVAKKIRKKIQIQDADILDEIIK